MPRKTVFRDDAAILATEWFSGKIGQISRLSKPDIDPSRPVYTYGIDSLVAIDLQNWFAREIGLGH